MRPMLECAARWVRAAALVAVSLASIGFGGKDAWAQERPRVAVAPVGGDHASADVKERFARSLAEGLLASGAEVAPSPSEAPYVLRGRVQVDGRSYALHLQMVDRRTGKVVASRDDRCEICTAAEAFETASAAASTLKSQVFKAPAAAGTGASAGGTGAAATASSKAPGAVPSVVVLGAPGGEGYAARSGGAQLSALAAAPPADLQARRSPPQHRGLGWAGVAAGLVGIGAGGLLVAIDGTGTCGQPGPCPRLFETRWGGFSSIGVGVVVVGAGILALLGKL
jgi:TolB-like protein